MKQLLLACLLLCAGCSSQTKEQKLISDYIKKNANDPASYEPVSFGPPRKCHLNEIPGASPADTVTIGVRIEHTYRAKNKLGALVIETSDFVVSKLNNEVLGIKTDGTAY
jgi:hypothetical protein